MREEKEHAIKGIGSRKRGAGNLENITVRHGNQEKCSFMHRSEDISNDKSCLRIIKRLPRKIV